MNSIEFFYSTMNAGKSLDLLRFSHTLEKIGKVVYITKPSIDTRNPNQIWSRIGVSRTCTTFRPVDTLRQLMKSPEKYDHLFIDEAQFMTVTQVEELAELVSEYPELSISCYGLLTDSNSILFPASKRLVELADKLTRIETLCACGKPATMSMRVSNGKKIISDQQILIGAEDSYIPVCREHWYNPGKIVKSLSIDRC